MTQGHRKYPEEKYGHGTLDLYLGPGDYGKHPDGTWYASPPDSGIGLGSLAGHEVTEHEDGTITVSPSILIDNKWHGYLERGIWRTV